MAFTNNYRMERVYFEKLKSMIDILKSFLNSETDQKARAMIENGIDADGAILLLYRNLGECWAEMSDLIKKANDRIDDLNDKSEAYHDELNERIDEVNNYLMALIRDLIARVESLESRMNAVEADLAQMGRVITYDLQRVNNAWTLTEGTQPVTFEQTAEYYNHERPHLVLVRGELNSEITYLLPREYDTTENTGLFEWYSFGFVGSEIHEITVTLLPDDSVNTAISTTDFAAILQRLTTAETNITDLQGRMTNAETDIDTLEQTAESHNDRITDLETCCDDVETALDGKQDTLVAGSGIAIDPTTNEITNTAQGAIYTGGDGIVINNDIIAIDENIVLKKYQNFPYYNSINKIADVSILKPTNLTYQTSEENIFQFGGIPSSDIALSSNVDKLNGLRLDVIAGGVSEGSPTSEDLLCRWKGDAHITAKLTFNNGKSIEMLSNIGKIYGGIYASNNINYYRFTSVWDSLYMDISGLTAQGIYITKIAFTFGGFMEVINRSSDTVSAVNRSKFQNMKNYLIADTTSGCIRNAELRGLYNQPRN